MRSCGVLMPISSLPSPYGIGSLGKEAYRFVDFLQKSGQHFWQILPIGPTGYGDSPYQSFSAFAANPYFIDLDALVGRGLLSHDEINAVRFGENPLAVDYGALYENRFALLHTAVSRFVPAEDGFANFRAKSADWLADYALFMALKAENGMVALSLWPEDLRKREPQALAAARARLAEQILFWEVVQYLFDEQWVLLKNYANAHHVEFIGDIPIYVSPDSSDLWAHPELFQVNDDGSLMEVAGCPPDAFSADGQLWGNPLYAWQKHLDTGCDWWVRRLKHAGSVYDVVRIDHFRGFESYYAIPAADTTAVGGVWRKGPGIAFINVIKEKLPQARIIAEDLGFLTEDVRILLAESGFPGMKVLQFAFDSREESDYLPHHYTQNSVVYTGTHDNTTTPDWAISAAEGDISFARRYLDADENDDLTMKFIRAALSSVSDTAIVPLQDWLHLGHEARMNLPSTLGGNWQWRVDGAALTEELAARIFELTKLFGRLV
ncbi:MAG: 4-alpha-glucanotransferase [Ruthenibacterium sp.]